MQHQNNLKTVILNIWDFITEKPQKAWENKIVL